MYSHIWDSRLAKFDEYGNNSFRWIACEAHTYRHTATHTDIHTHTHTHTHTHARICHWSWNWNWFERQVFSIPVDIAIITYHAFLFLFFTFKVVFFNDFYVILSVFFSPLRFSFLFSFKAEFLLSHSVVSLSWRWKSAKWGQNENARLGTLLQGHTWNMVKLFPFQIANGYCKLSFLFHLPLFEAARSCPVCFFRRSVSDAGAGRESMLCHALLVF